MRAHTIPLSRSQIQARLLMLAGIFLFIYAVVLTLAPAARARSWNVSYHWSQWVGLGVWLGVISVAHTQIERHIPEADPFLLPLAAILSGWGILTIYRLLPSFGLRQTIWLGVCGLVFLFGLRLSPELRFLRRYKYIWLTGGLILTALTIFFGTDPGGGYEHAWLGCCGVYFQPSEPLKLLLIVYLAAYLADRLPFSLRPLPLLAPTIVIMGIALLLLIVQRDLGTASIFIFLYAIILFISTGKKRILLISLVGLVVAGLAGYFFFDVVRLRVDAWLNPWLDPSGRSFQIVQSLMAVANGGTSGRGPGMGSPGLVPVAISDFIFVAIAEETGLVGTIGLLAILGFFVARGVRTAMRAPDSFRRILAAGLTAYIGAQSILIIGGNIRLFPLTGVTLPFVSYGGSSLLTSFLALLMLLFISCQPENEPAPLPTPQPYLILAGLIGAGLFSLAIANAWWAVWRGPDLLQRTDNARRSIDDRYVKRGSLMDRNETPIDFTNGKIGDYQRIYAYPNLASITGYTDAVYGQAGLESTLDATLRGLQGNPASSIWWNHLVYGQPPPGLDVRLSIDLDLQKQADSLLGSNSGAIVLLNAKSGEILAIASHPTYDPNKLNQQANALIKDPKSPLLDRAAQELYPIGTAMNNWLARLGGSQNPSAGTAEQIFTSLGFFTTPDLRLPAAAAVQSGSSIRISPLQAALTAAALSNGGMRPPARLAMAVRIPLQGWVVLPTLSQPVQALPVDTSNVAVQALRLTGQPLWQWTGQAGTTNKPITWALAGTLPNWQGTPLATVVLLEDNNRAQAVHIGQSLLLAAMQP
ncbi:MAG TPA: FtsW/RodA/SpoVE family cell cycle protein [Anaerolineales bacterium]|nr:FtsW/RodA/SpoVE family cell cycle protein [Anaerolineales bacterium]